MDSEDRLNPDDVLKSINDEARKRARGQLRVFLGMSAGVGKTYAMLRHAHERLREGVDVVIGVVETHGRAETAKLLAGLPLIARQKISYRDSELEEMDLDAILQRKPQLVIVDELAHSNVVGSRHEKRYQDVIEILDAGIDVYTALNVQHLESRKDAVEAITGIRIHETVPDSILEQASLVELVDIAPSELLKRLKAGHVYQGDKAERAAENFFKEDKLTALREIALRMTAERVDQDLQKMRSQRRDNPWHTNERLLVAISHSPYSEKLIRATRRLAYNLEAPWIAVYVDTGLTLSDQDSAQLNKNLQLARELKAEVLTTTDMSFTEAVRRICRQKNVTQVVIGRPTRSWLRSVIEGGSLLENLTKKSSDVDIHIIRQDAAALPRPGLVKEISLYRSTTSMMQYLYTAVFLMIITAFAVLFESYMGYRSVGYVYLMSVLLVGSFGSIGSVTLAAFASSLIWNYFFIPPKYTFVIEKPDDLVVIFIYFFVALITGFLTYRIRRQSQLIREREEKTNVLYEVLKDIANSPDKAEFLEKVLTRIGPLMGASCYVILKEENGELLFNEQKSYSVYLNEKKQAVAQWSFQNKKPAGWSTDTLSESPELYIPLKGSFETVGLFVLRSHNKMRRLKLDQENLLYSVVNQLGSSLERHFITKRLQNTQRLQDSEHLHQTLLNTISHEMRTPLTALIGSSSALENDSVFSDAESVKIIVEDIRVASERLNHVVENLLDMSRLNSGVLSLTPEWHDLTDLMSAITTKQKKSLQNHKFEIKIDDDAHMVKIDFRLFEHAISNLILNSTLYTPQESEIKFEASRSGDKVILKIADNGPGIPAVSIPKIFDKFYRVPGSPAGGTGLGLSIVKSIVELHQGTLSYEENKPHGALFKIELPAREPILTVEGEVP